MIVLTRFNGPQFLLNPDLIERVDATPDTVITLVNGTKYVVAENVESVIDLVVGYHARILATADTLVCHGRHARHHPGDLLTPRGAGRRRGLTWMPRPPSGSVWPSSRSSGR